MRTIAICLLSLSFLQGCTVVGAAIGAAATAGSAALQERGLTGVLSDAEIEGTISKAWFDHDFDMFQNLNLKVYEGRVLITGFVTGDEQRFDAIRLAWKPNEVKEVINEILIGNGPTLSQKAKDTWISSQIEGKLLVQSEVLTLNYNIHTIKGTVYLIGVAQNENALEIVTNIARSIEGVEKVISYVRLKNQNLPPEPEAEESPNS